MSEAPMRVLIVAENASTRFGGEAILPYHYFRLLRGRGVDAHLIVHARTRDELKMHFPGERTRIHFVEDQPLQKLLYSIGKLLPRRIAEATFGLANQLLTQHMQRGILRRLVNHPAKHSARTRTVIHQPIPVSPRFPSLLYDLGAPVVIGPLNGGMDYPPAFRGAESRLSRQLIALGRSFTDAVNAIFPGKRRAVIVLVANARTRAALPSKLQGRVLELAENAVDLSQWNVSGIREIKPSTSFVFMGRLVDWKALDIVIAALEQVPEASLDVIGDGPMLGQWRTLAAQLGLSARVRFHGWLPQPACANFLANSCALVLPSLYECGGAVVLEAMAMACPVIAADWGGPADYLDPSCGILVEPAGDTALIQGFAEAMRRLIDSPAQRERMGAAGREKLLRDFDWHRKIDLILDIYASTLQ